VANQDLAIEDPETLPEEEKPRETTVEFLASLASTLVTVLFIVTFVGQTFAIPTSSMENTLLIGDHLFVDRIRNAPASKWFGPLLPYRPLQRGDVIVFLSPAEPTLHLVKRVIGVPGDRIHLRQGIVYRNGEKLNEPYVIHPEPVRYDAYRDDFPAVLSSDFGPATPEWQAALPGYVQGGDLVVPEGKYFAMGDNRDVSLDSRYWGFVPKENLIGRPTYIYWSFETPPGDYQRTAFSERVQSGLHMIVHFFDMTRWKRTFTLVR
jgi:signal peptidase I